MHCADAAELCRRICAHRKQLLDVVNVQGDHGRGSLKISAQITPSNSVQQLQVLKVTEQSGDSVCTLAMTSMLQAINLPSVTDMGAEIFSAGDLKLLQLLYGIKTGNAKCPCPWCWWSAGEVDRDLVAASCQKRDIEADVRDFVEMGSDRAETEASAVTSSKTYLVFR